jgi:hypothetical protein
MNDRALVNRLRIESGSIILSMLPMWVSVPWRLFGSWAIFLYSHGSMRLPRDVDVELLSHGPTVSGESDLRIWHNELPVGEYSLGQYRCAAARPHNIQFSEPHRNPLSYWQRMDLYAGTVWLSTETVNWVERRSRAIPAQVVNVRCLDVDWADCGDVRAYPCAPLEECLALKWTRISRTRSGGRRHTRWEDLADLYDAVALSKVKVSLATLRQCISELGEERGITTPLVLPEPPLEWLDFWDNYNYITQIKRPPPGQAALHLNEIVSRTS